MSRVRQAEQQKAGHQLPQQGGASQPAKVKGNPKNSSGKSRKY